MVVREEPFRSRKRCSNDSPGSKSLDQTSGSESSDAAPLDERVTSIILMVTSHNHVEQLSPSWVDDLNGYF